MLAKTQRIQFGQFIHHSFDVSLAKYGILSGDNLRLFAFRLLIRGALFLLILSGCQSYAERKQIDAERSQQNEERAKLTILALDQFFLNHGQFPEKLEELVPVYLPEMPTTYYGKSFEYYVSKEDGYGLCYKLDTIGCCYTYSISFWDCSPTNIM